MTRIEIIMQSIGRSQNAPGGGPHIIRTVLSGAHDDVDVLRAVAAATSRHAKKYLASHEFDVTASPDGTVKIEFGRFGVSEWREVPE